ncbi:MAG: HlyC/CorC family transporter [Rhodospirillales bacterium]|nr:MAG: HlyC/CorC family transporter [Rhodospirillales bacterium]
MTQLDWIYLGIIFCLLLASALFSCSETALTAVSRPLMHQLEQNGSKRARTVNWVLARRDSFIGALLLGNNLVNILASALATSVLIGLFGEAGVAYATGVMTVIVVVFGEALPKTYAITHADRASLFLGPFVRLVVFLLSPIQRLMQAIVWAILHLMGVRHSQHDIEKAMTELRGAIEIHTEGSEEVKHERAMLKSILELADVEVGEIMTHRKSAYTVDLSQPAQTIVEQVLASPYTRIPLWRDNPDNIVGVLHAKDMLRSLNMQKGDASALDLEKLASPPWFVPDSTSLLDQMQAFRDRHEHFALVVDEYGALMGVVTLEDIIEEIVGDIADEHDVAVAGVRVQADGSAIVNGQVTLRDLNREFDWRLPDDQASTLAGLILHESRRIPDAGQVFRFHGFRFEILRRHKNQIALVRVTPPGPAGTSN